jgi:acyl-ACP thioesterase
MELVFTQRFQVHTYEVGPRLETRLESLMGYLQEAAVTHGARYKIGVEDLQEHGQTWVLSRYHLEVLRYPRLGEEIDVTTWPSGVNGIFALRDYHVADAHGAPIARATTSLVVVDMKTKQPVLADTVLPEGFLRPERAIQDPFSRLPTIENGERPIELPVMLRDLDLNGHVSHTVYLQWALEALPELSMRSQPSRIELGFKAETILGDAVVSQVQSAPSADGLIFLHEISSRQTGTELARARLSWKQA